MAREFKPRKGRHRFVGRNPKNAKFQRMDIMVPPGVGGKEAAIAWFVDNDWTDLHYWPRPRAFALDKRALDRATDHLDIKWPVEVRYRPHSVMNQTGVYSFFPGLHRITIDSTIGWRVDPERGPVVNQDIAVREASMVLYHELTHARQGELQGIGYSLHHAAEAQIPYDQRPSEIEATANESLVDVVGLLYRPTRV